jgi:hypothetical protein
MIQPSDFTKIKHDVNGNPRHVLHFIHISRNYDEALFICKKLGGKKFHNKQYGGGIVFQEYTGCLDNLCERLNALIQPEINDDETYDEYGVNTKNSFNTEVSA